MGESISKKLADYLAENYDISENMRGSLKIGEFSFAGNGLVTRFFNNFIVPHKKDLKDICPDWLFLSETDFKEKISNILPTTREILESRYKEIQLEQIKNEVEEYAGKEVYMRGIPVVDMEDPRGGAIIIDKSTSRRLPIEEKGWERVVGTKHASMMREIGYCGHFFYDPSSSDPVRITETAIGKENYFNLYIPPMVKVSRDRSAKLDPDFIKFFETLFTTKASLSYAINWIYYSLYEKIPVYLVMVGSGGIGKNYLAESLKKLHGESNFTKAPPSALNSKFNGHLENCTMLYYDECKFNRSTERDTDKKNRLKEWANNTVPIEVKGVDAKTKDIHCSAIIATNNDSDVHIEQLDRKFAVLELTEERLEKRLGADITQKLWKYLNDESMPHAFLNYLEERIDPEFNIHQEYKGEKFNHLVYTSLFGWQQELLSRIENAENELISIADCRENISLFPRHTSKIDDFLKNFTVDGHKLGKVVQINGKPTIKINPELLPPVKEDAPLMKGEI
jgi:hypothetical protein